MSTAELRVLQRRAGRLPLAGRETRRVLSLWTQTILPPVLTTSSSSPSSAPRSAHGFARSKGSTT